MAKQNKTTKQVQRTKVVDRKDFLYLAGTVFVVLFIYSFSLFRPWLPFDERLIYKEDFFPIPQRFDEISEIINTFILKAHIISGNSLFSNIFTLRSNPLASALIVFVSFFFKKQAFLYHAFQLFIHLINVALVFIIFKNLIGFVEEKNETVYNFKCFTASFFAILWGIHSASLEAVLLVSNFTTLITYTICFYFIYYEINQLQKNKLTFSSLTAILLSILFFFAMFFTEYGYTLPFIIFFIVFSLTYKITNSIRKALNHSIKRTTPYLAGVSLFILYSAFNSDSLVQTILNSKSSNYIFIERNLWLTPQLFIHLFKLMIFPKTLSLFQSNHVYLADKLISFYSIFSTTLYILFLSAPILLFLVSRKQRFSYIFPLLYSLYFGIFPFIHSAAPAYCLSADRYCYFPVFLLLIILICLIYRLLKPVSINSLKLISIIFSLIILSMGIRTLIRITEWNDPYKIFKSAASSQKDPLYKGQRLNILADYVGEHLKDQEKMEALLEESLSYLNKALHNFEAKSKVAGNQPVTLKIYGLDYKTLAQKAAYSIAVIKNDNYLEPPNITLSIFEPYIESNLKSAGINQILFYSEILVKANLLDKAKEVLEYGYKKFGYSDDILNKLAEYYTLHERDSDKSLKVLQHAYNLFPNNSIVLSNLLKYYEQKNDSMNEAKFAYLYGLRMHSLKHYQLSTQIYLDSNQLKLAKESLRKSIRLKEDDPLTLLLTSRYLDLAGQRSKILGVLNRALISSHKLGDKQDLNVTKSILVSLINVNANLGNTNNAKQFLGVFEGIKDLTAEDKAQIQASKKLLSVSTQ